MLYAALCLFYFPLENFSLHIIWRRHNCPWRAEKVWPILRTYGFWACTEESLSFDICCHTGLWCLWSPLKDCPIKSPLTYDKQWALRTYSSQVRLLENKFLFRKNRQILSTNSRIYSLDRVYSWIWRKLQ